LKIEDFSLKAPLLAQPLFGLGFGFTTITINLSPLSLSASCLKGSEY
jgi:hypothetical protein